MDMYETLLAGRLSGNSGGSGTTNYNALDNKPKINNVELSGNKTTADLNITFSASDVGALPDSTKFAASMTLTIDSQTYVVTAQLKDQDGNNLGSAQTIDLPLETMVVSGSYDSNTKEVVLTLKNGQTVRFSVADLVSGLQTELSAANKLDPAYINYNSTHAAVTEAEKATWSAKQSALDSIQLAAVNSGINSTKVAQIAANTSNITKDGAALVELVDGGAKNLLDLTKATNVTKVDEINYVINANGSLTVTWSGLSAAKALRFLGIPYIAGDLVLSGCPAGEDTSTYRAEVRQSVNGVETAIAIDEGSGSPTFQFNNNTFIYVVRCAAGSGEKTFYPMLCTPASWNISSAYQPYRPSYQELYERVVALEQANI